MTDSTATTGDKATFGDGVKKFFQTEPALIRGFLIALTAILAKIVNVEWLNNDTVDMVVNLYVSIAALVAVWWTRGVVTPVSKVLAFKSNSGEILPGAATTDGPVEEAQAAIAVKMAA